MNGAAWWTLVAVAGAVGALLRHEATVRASDPLVALHVVNVTGAGLLGLVATRGPHTAVVGALALGGLGAFTSFSTWVVQARGRAVVPHLVLPLVGAVAAALAGAVLGRALGGGA